MDLLLSIDFTSFVDNAILFLGNYGFIIVIVFGIAHPILENPLSLFNLALAITLLGAGLGYIVVFVSNIIGILILYFLVMKFKDKYQEAIEEKKVADKVLNWIKNTDTWRHIIVIGVPMIPTYPIKIAVPLSGVGFKKYMVTLVGAYLFLFFGNTLIYYGVLGIVTDNIPNYVSFILLSLFVVYIYFGHRIFYKEKLDQLGE
ncbi:MAG: SNARE associated Golgi protein [Candidatus Izimaplasma bacterium HR2]|nr:MAG: SNARE associated Golgi protein [Candidatus Izimaplasma bacterium HR2]